MMTKNDGYTLLELMMVLAVVGILMGAFAVGAQYLSPTKVAAAAQQLNHLRSGAVMWKSMTASPTYQSITSTAMINSGVVRSGDWTSPWGYSNTIVPANGNNGVQITMAGVPDAASCQNLASQANSMWGNEVVLTLGGSTLCSAGACSGLASCNAGDMNVLFVD